MKEELLRLQAHRGVSTDYPENTMVAFRGAVEQGYDIIELDPEEEYQIAKKLSASVVETSGGIKPEKRRDSVIG